MSPIDDPRDSCSGCFGFGPCVDPGRHGRTIGPIERELRTLAPHGYAFAFSHLSHRAFPFFLECRNSWWRNHDSRGDGTEKCWPDHMSEAIEAAEALGL